MKELDENYISHVISFCMVTNMLQAIDISYKLERLQSVSSVLLLAYNHQDLTVPH